EASHWVTGAGITADDDLSYLREFQHITLARLMLAEGKAGAMTVDFLDRLLQAAERGGRTGSAIEVLILKALACQAVGDVAGAVSSLGRSLDLGEPQEYVRVFVDEGEAIAPLLKSAIKHRIAPHYAKRLLEALGSREQ